MHEGIDQQHRSARNCKENHQLSAIFSTPLKEQNAFTQASFQEKLQLNSIYRGIVFVSLEAGQFMLEINCYQESYCINLNCLQSIKGFLQEIDQSHTITNAIKKSLMLIVVEKASQFNQKYRRNFVKKVSNTIPRCSFYSIFSINDNIALIYSNNRNIIAAAKTRLE